MRTGVLVLPHRRYSMPETVMRKYRLRQRAESLSSDSSSEGGGRRRGRPGVDRASQTSPPDSWRTFPSLATPSPRALSSAFTSDCQTVSDKTVSTQDSTLSVPSTNSDRTYRGDVETQVSLPEQEDRTTSVTGLRREPRLVEVAVKVEAELSDDTLVETSKWKNESVQVEDLSQRSIACQADQSPRFRIPDISVMKDSTESQVTKEESSQVCRKDIMQEMDPLGFHVRNARAEVACAGTNYDEYPLVNPVVPRYSAVPRTNSMLVNTSSVDLSSDSELSLTDSLEDPEETRTQPCRRRHSRHDERMVRGEVAVEQERRRLPKARDAYAYFLSLTGEEDAIREYAVPDWLRDRLRRREEEIKKVYEDKLSRHQQCGYFRRRKKVVKRVKQRTAYSSSEKIKKNEILISDTRPKKTIHYDNYGTNNVNNNVNPSTSDKGAVTILNGNNMGLQPKIDNIHKSNNIQNALHNNNNNGHLGGNGGGNPSQLFIQAETTNRSGAESNLVQISEIIKIEMSDNMRTVITKEKQINMPTESNVSQAGSATIKNELSNNTKIVSSNADNSHSTTEVVESNVLNSVREIIVPNAEIKYNESNLTHNKLNENSQVAQKSVAVGESGPLEDNSKFKEVSKAVIQKSGPNSEISLDRKIADILINALEENTKAHKMCGKNTANTSIRSKTETKIESISKIYVNQESAKIEEKPEIEEQKNSTVAVQTDEIPESPPEKKNLDKSCITEPYFVSIRLQTSEHDDSGEDPEDADNCSEGGYIAEEGGGGQEEDAVASFESLTEGKVKMMDKACNTFESASVSTQTTESILQSEDIVNGFTKSKSTKKKDVQFPPQVIKQIITGTGEYKTVQQANEKGIEKDKGRGTGTRKGRVSKGTNTEEETMVESKNMMNNNIEIMSNRGHPTPFCKNVFPSKAQQKKTQVLELNVPACSCHMCTLQKISPRAETSKSRIPQSKKPPELPKDEKKSSTKISVKRNSAMGTKFQMFEVIPEEKTSSSESAQEDKRDESMCEEKAISTDPHLVDQVVQVGSYNESVATNTEPPESSESDQDRTKEGERGTQTDSKREVVTQTDSKREGVTQTDSRREGVTQTDSKREGVTQTDSKREEVAQTGSRREELTQTDSTREEVTQTDSTQHGSTQTISMSQRKSSNLVIGRFRSESKESPMLVRQYKGRASLSAGHLEEQEELLTLSKGWINFYLLKDNFDLSDSNDEPGSVCRRREGRRRDGGADKVEEYSLEIHATPEPRTGRLPNLRQPPPSGGGGLPEIVRSGSSSPAQSPTEEQGGRRRGRQPAVGPLPGVRKTRRVDVKREAVLTERRAEHQPPTQTSRAVEVAEQSISSITSSTVIMSESPPPQQLKLPERKSSQRKVHRSLHLNNGSSWTVTVAGSSGAANDPPPDVEMKLSFGKQSKKQEENLLQYQVARPKRQGQLIEEYSHVTRNEKHAVQCVQDLSLHTHHTKSILERGRGGTAKDNFSYEEDYINRLSSRRSRYSTEDGSEIAADLHVTGLAITPEKKPRVPTQSERDILRPQQRYKFTR